VLDFIVKKTAGENPLFFYKKVKIFPEKSVLYSRHFIRRKNES